MSSATLSADKTEINITFSEPVFSNSDGSGNIEVDDILLMMVVNAGYAIYAWNANSIQKVSDCNYKLSGPFNVAGITDNSYTIAQINSTFITGFPSNFINRIDVKTTTYKLGYGNGSDFSNGATVVSNYAESIFDSDGNGAGTSQGSTIINVN